MTAAYADIGASCQPEIGANGISSFMGLPSVCVLGDKQFKAAGNPTRFHGGIEKLKCFVHAASLLFFARLSHTTALNCVER